MRSRLFILCGLPFSGKTTLARALAKRFGLDHVELDQINSERGLGLDGQAISPADWDETYRQAHARLTHLLASSRSAIFDATSFTQPQRDDLRCIAESTSAEAITIYVDVPLEEARRRWQANRQRGLRFDVRDEDFQNVVDNFEPPTEDEQAILFDGTVPPEEWAAHLGLHQLDDE